MLQRSITAELEKGLGILQTERGPQSEETTPTELQAKLEATGTLKTSEYQRMLSVPTSTHVCTMRLVISHMDS